MGPIRVVSCPIGEEGSLEMTQSFHGYDLPLETRCLSSGEMGRMNFLAVDSFGMWVSEPPGYLRWRRKGCCMEERLEDSGESMEGEIHFEEWLTVTVVPMGKKSPVANHRVEIPVLWELPLEYLGHCHSELPSLTFCTCCGDFETIF